MEKEIICFSNPGLPIDIHSLDMRDGGIYRGLHSHTAIEIVKVKNGILSCYIDGDAHSVHSGQTVLINSNIRHKLSSENAEITYMRIDISCYKESNYQDELARLYDFIAGSKAKPYLILSDNQELDEILRKINEKYYENRKYSSWYIKAYLYELIAFMYSKSFITPLDLSAEQIKKIHPIVRYVDANFRLPITLDDICIAGGYNRYTVCHTFKTVTGSTVFGYINFLRIRYAREKLKNSKLTILEVAAECGFSSVTYFNRVFKNMTGCTPSVYRKYF